MGLNVKRFRKDLGISQEQLAFDCGLHRTYVSGVERGIRNPTVVILESLAKGLKIPVWRLLEEQAKLKNSKTDR
ncbi:MAG: helix-turn-helix domain-containing protein [Rhodospirillales bacterium]|nr:helix-turn-helix domain-containing protein [Rhodospirillales bacterium]